MASVSNLRAGLMGRLATITGLRTHSTIPDQVNPPCAVVGFPESVEFDTTFARGADRFVFPIRVLAGKVSERSAQDRLDTYVAGSGTGSIKAAIEDEPTLGEVAHTSRVQSASGYGVYEVGGVSYLGVEFRVEVYAPGDTSTFIITASQETLLIAGE